MNLEEVRPAMGSFKLEATKEHVHELRKFSLDDHVWVRETFGKGLDEIATMTPGESLPIITRIVYRLIKDKSIFIKQEVKTIDEEGNEGTDTLGGVRLFSATVCGPQEQNDMIEAFLKTLSASNPKPDDKKKQAKKP